MTENSERCCTCTTPEITIKLNKQGPQGLTGPQGEPGFSPVIEVSEETPTSYRLSIQTLEGSYETPNLKANFPLGGYVNQVLVKQSNADGDATWDYIPYATTETTGGLTLATEDDVVVGSDKAITGDILAKVVANFNDTLTGYVDLTSAQSISGTKTFDGLYALGIHTHYLDVTSGEIQAGGVTVIASENLNVPGERAQIRVGNTSLPLYLIGQSGVIQTYKNSSFYDVVDSGNIGDYLPSNIVTVDSDGVVQTTNIKLPTRTYLGTSLWSRAGRDIIHSNPTQYSDHGGIELGNITDKLSMSSRDEITIMRGTNGQNYDNYTNLDSGNISSDPYIQSLVARIEALES